MIQPIHTHGAHFDAHTHRAHACCVLSVKLDCKSEPPGRKQEFVSLRQIETRRIAIKIGELSSLSLLYLWQKMVSDPFDVRVRRAGKFGGRRVRRHEGGRDVNSGLAEMGDG